MSADAEINRRAQEMRARLDPLYREIEKVIVGQRNMVDRLLIGLLTGGHILLEGVPGLAKTLAARTLAQTLQLSFHRIQFTPDLLPADVVGTQIFNPRTGEFSIKKGPIFANCVLADEINRAPAKVQSALLEAMQEKQVTIGDHTYILDKPFMVLATQNPIEQEGTYPLPEAQMDRFMLKVKLDYPSKEEELAILNRMSAIDVQLSVEPQLGSDTIFELRRAIDEIHVDEKIKQYIIDVVHATRKPADYGVDIGAYVQYGASPRATIFLTRGARANALLAGRGYVTPQDVKAIGYDVLRHRISVTYEAEAEDLTSDDLVKQVFDRLKVPLKSATESECKEMRQVLFNEPFFGLPIYGYGMMLFLAYFFCNWLASWLAKKEGIPPHTVYDLGIWLFVCGIIGARITFMIYDNKPFTLWNFVALWDGGLIFYGSAIGGVVGYLGAYYFILRKYKISSWKMADVIAPCVALGLCLGRIGCLLNGCCYGNVACPDCPAIGFPLPTGPRFAMVEKGYQTAAGFTLSEQVQGRVALVEPGSPAALAKLRVGDEILEIERDGEMKQVDVYTFLGDHRSWPRGQNELTMKVRHADGQEEKIGPFTPWTIGLHPTQIYESISTALLALLLLAYFPYRRRDGELMVLLMLFYSVHRFLNEILRIDTGPVAFGMTLSQNISVVVFLGGIVLGIWIWQRGTPRSLPPPAVAAAPSS